MEIAIAILNVGFIIFISYQIWRKEQTSLRKFFFPALLLKLAAGIVLGLVYTYYYTVGDTFNYFNDGVKLASLARADIASYLSFLWSSDESSPVWRELIYTQPRAMFLSKITSLFCVLTADNYWVISLYFSSISFFCSWLLLKKIIAIHPPAELAAVISFLFFPSVVFWSSGVIKESIAVASLFLLCFIFIKIFRNEKLHAMEWILTFLSLWLLWNLKYYYLAVFLPVVITTLMTKLLLSRLKLKNTFLKVGLWGLLFIIPLLLVSILHPNFYPERFMGVVVSSYYEFKSLSDPEDLILYTSLKPTPWSILQNAPLALFSGLFRPFLTESRGDLQFFVAIENLILLTFTVLALLKLKNLTHCRYRILLFSILVYSLMLCVFLALSTPNFGTLSRYRVGFLPFFVFLLTIENPLINKLITSKSFRNLVR